MISRRNLLAAAPVALATPMLIPVKAMAEVTPADAQVPGLSRTWVGDIEVTAISDGYIPLSPDLFSGADQPTIIAATEASPQRNPLTGAINAFAVNTGGKLYLIDAGGSAAIAPSMGRFAGNLAAAGIQPADVDEVLMTHLHVDHIGGLTDADGAAIFPNAGLTMLDTEHGFWTAEGLLEGAPDGFKPFVQAAQRAVAAYADRITLISGEASVAPGVTSLPVPGHTPGMAAWRIASGDAQLLMWADIVHAPALQFAHPAWSIAFDTDAAAAAATRARILDMVATDRIAILGSHLPFPGHGYVVRDGQAYEYQAATWDYGF
jgi:glyoxylase-like metal-dependent hydrolase (beta-lactamase superfamily II)